jgi:serine protease inhibitor ecotin
MIAALFSVLLLAAETPATSAEAVNVPAQEAAPTIEPTKKAERKICRVDPAQTGSRMKTKLCLTQTEWDRRAAGKSVGDLKTLGAR